ncbi:PTS lactose/cellobiose transporter subunit IIA [Eubacterium multiforme]|uniref:PTS system cellobiose-specific IIA component n=1 Tax=Eubacterium multiforme TaxID=83339 RepID=A0ABT9UXX0_9FIRM|nr:PTS lactose/cellobiose transporter subunit IIA [Eubacterium multiforme]MDQ0151089.1 PTS system cellobiose-specific IIA component [Eubacterium multiforme]
MEKYSQSFKLILHAGISKSKSAEAITLSKSSEFLKAELILEEAKKELILAHKAQQDLMNLEIEGKDLNLNMLLIHAQDHICGAEMYINFAMETLELRKEILNLRKEFKKL